MTELTVGGAFVDEHNLRHSYLLCTGRTLESIDLSSAAYSPYGSSKSDNKQRFARIQQVIYDIAEMCPNVTYLDTEEGV